MIGMPPGDSLTVYEMPARRRYESREAGSARVGRPPAARGAASVYGGFCILCIVACSCLTAARGACSVCPMAQAQVCREPIPSLSRMCSVPSLTMSRSKPLLGGSGGGRSPRDRVRALAFSEGPILPLGSSPSSGRAYLPDDVVAPVAACSTLFGQSGLSSGRRRRSRGSL